MTSLCARCNVHSLLYFLSLCTPIVSTPLSFSSFSIVSCSLCSSLSDNKLFIFTLMTVLLWFFPPYVLQMHNNFLFLPFVCVCLWESEGKNGAFISNYAPALVSHESVRLKRTLIFLPLQQHV